MRAAALTRRGLLALGAGVVAAAASRRGAAATPGDTPRPGLVLTAMQATHSLTMALASGTGLQVRNIPADGREMALLKDYIQRRFDSLQGEFAAATAVVSLTNALPADPLYRFARQANIRIVNIDAAIPWQTDMPGVALVETPRTNVPWSQSGSDPGPTCPYLWLGISNAIRMADIIAHDLAALFPASGATVSRNLDALRRGLIGLRSGFQQGAGADIDAVFALTGDFVYLTNDLGLFVDGYCIRQDAEWTPAALADLTGHLRDRAIRLVLHRWEPSASIVQAVKAGGAQLVVLDTGDPGVVVDGQLAADGLQQVLARNLELLGKAAAAAGR